MADVSHTEEIITPGKKAARADTSAVEWVQALRDAKITEKVIADVASANFEERWHQLAEGNQKKFDRGEIDHAALMQLDLEHDDEREKEMRAVLGDQGFRHWDENRLLADVSRTGVQLSVHESDQLYDMRREADRKRLDLDKARLAGKLTDQDSAAQSEALSTQYNQQLLKFLGNDRYAQMENGGDTGTSELKQNLRGIQADDSQIAGMQTEQQTWNSQRNDLDIKLQQGDITAEDYEKQTKALETQRDEEYKKVLGSDAFAEFQRNQNPQYQSLKGIGASLGFTADDINGLYATIQGYQNEVTDYRDRAKALENQGQTIDWSGVDKVLQNFSQQTETALRDKLGERFDKFKRSNLMPFER